MRISSFVAFFGLIFGGLATAPLRGAVPAASLVGHWRFDHVNAGGAEDLAPRPSVPMQLEEPAFHAENAGARSLNCDGAGVAGVLEERTPLAFPDGLTLGVWVYPIRARGFEPLVGRPNPNPVWTTPLTGFYLQDGRIVFGIFGPKKLLLDGPELPLRTWSFVMATTDGHEAALWLNGRKVASAAQPLPIPAAAGQRWYVGRSQMQYFRGRIGEMLLWSRALSAAEVESVQHETAPRYPKPEFITARWHDRTVAVESPGTRPTGAWRPHSTRTLDGLDGFRAAGAPKVDRWGGRTDRPAQQATGFFRTAKIEGRWWFVTPEGHLYWNVGVNGVRPPRRAPAGAFAVAATAELRELGFNGLGNGAVTTMQTVAQPLPWSIRMNFMSSFAVAHKQTYATSGHTGFNEQCFPVFHPDFPAWAREHAKQLAATVNDASVLGIFTDNELQCPIDVLDRHLKLPAADPYFGPGHAAAVAWLKARSRPADPAQLTVKDRYEFIAHMFATYAHIVHDAIRAVDGHHLILGPRFNEHRSEFENPWLWSAVGPWIDVVAVNYYNLWGPQRDDIQAWSDALQRPVILTEWYSKALDAPGLANTNGAGWVVRTQIDRAHYYQHFALAAFETPALVGFHYFKYLDDGSESVALDAAGGANKGLYQADGAPWPELLTAAKAVNRNVYPLIDFFDGRRGPTDVLKASASGLPTKGAE